MDLVLIAGHAEAADAAAEHLRVAGVNYRIAADLGPELIRQPEAPEEPLLVVFASRRHRSWLLELSGHATHGAGGLIPALTMDSVGQIGPVVSRAGPCLGCLAIRQQDATGSSWTYDFPEGSAALWRQVGVIAARRAVGRLARNDCRTPDNVVTYCWNGGASSNHVLLPTRHCAVCAPKLDVGYQQSNDFLADTQARATSRTVLEVEGRLVDPVLGPVLSVGRLATSQADPRLRQWGATALDAGWRARGVHRLHCGGSSLSDDVAKAAALGESLERISLSGPVPGAATVATYRAVSDRAVDPLEWDMFDPETRSHPEFPFEPLSWDAAITWVWGWSTSRAAPVMVPASRVFLAMERATPADLSDHPPYSGSACSHDVRVGVLRALLEVIERDTFMIAWTNRLALQRLDLQGFPELEPLVRAFEDRGVALRCSTLTLDFGVPFVLAMARSSSGSEPAWVVGAASALTMHEAAGKAIAELATSRLYVKKVMEGPEGRDHTASWFYARGGHSDLLEEWWDPAKTVDGSGPVNAVQNLEELQVTIHAKGSDVLVVDITPPEAREFGLWVVKVLVPGAYPINFDSRWPHLGGTRMTTIPVSQGLRRTPLTFAEMNRTPHPFP